MTIKLDRPFSPEKIRNLRVGNIVGVTGTILTGRDRFHKYLFEGGVSPVNLKDGAIYHCGPVMLRRNGAWICQASGPTTSAREEPFMASLIEKYGIRVIIGKGGMGQDTCRACAKFGCVYLEAVGGTAQVLNAKIKKVVSAHMLREFGLAEAVWELDVEDFPAIVAIDSRGRNIHRNVRAFSRRMLAKMFAGSPFKG